MESRRAPLRVAVVEDQPLFRSMLVTLLEAQPDVDVVVAVGSVAEAHAAIGAGTADVALLDIELPDGNGVELGRALRRSDPGLGILLLSSQDVMEVLLSLAPAEREGWSYLSKTSTTSEATLLRALHASASGRTVLDPDLVRLAVPRAGSPLAQLTPRQFTALRLVAEGLSNSAIAAELNISVHSVDNLLNGLYSALGLETEPTRNRRVSAVLLLIGGSSRTAQRMPSP